MFTRFQYMLSLLRTDPVGGTIYILSFAAAILIALILHEWAHGFVAYRCGDPTAKMMGRLSLNPAHHLDPVGTLCMVVFGIGWAKPVPVNPRNFRNYRRDDFLVSIAGILMNLTLFLLSTALLVAIQNHVRYSALMQYVYNFVYLLSSINLSLALFNLLPIPPLDGYHLVNDTLLKGRLQLNHQQFQVMQIILIVVCLTGVLSNLLGSLHSTIYSAVLNLFYRMIP